MKFINKLKNKEFDSFDGLFDSLCHGEGCDFCILYKIREKERCRGWAKENMDEFLKFLYCEAVQEIPHICKILGVEIGERFRSPFDGADICIDKCGLPQFPDHPQNQVPAWIIADMINKPTTLILKKKWTPQEIEDAKTILRMFGKDNFTHVQKDEDGWPSLMDEDWKDPNVGWWRSIGMEKDMFPSLKPGQTVRLADIVGGDD